MRNLANELAPIRVNVVVPGAVETELWDGIRAAGDFEKFKEGLKSSSTTGQIGAVEDVVHAYLFLMKDQNASGSVVHSNSGVNVK